MFKSATRVPRLLIKYCALISDEKTRLSKLLYSCTLQSGLLMRYPDNSGGYEARDNTIAALTMSNYLRLDFAKEFLDYGRIKGALSVDSKETDAKKRKYNEILFSLLSLFSMPVKYVYNNIDQRTFHKSSWIGRHLETLCHAHFCANVMPKFYLRVAWSISVFLGALSKDQDGKVLMWMLVKVARGKSLLCDLVTKFWIFMLKRQYKGGIGEVLGLYYSSAHFEHPSSKLLMNEFGE